MRVIKQSDNPLTIRIRDSVGKIVWQIKYNVKVWREYFEVIEDPEILSLLGKYQRWIDVMNWYIGLYIKDDAWADRYDCFEYIHLAVLFNDGDHT